MGTRPPANELGRFDMAVDIWSYRETVVDLDLDLSGFKVEAEDGEIGKVDEAAYAAGADSIIVDTGPWILGKKVMLPVGTIERIDLEERKLYVDRTKEEIKNAPEYDSSGYAQQEYREHLGGYYKNLYT
jgi:hypothetical protein